MRGRPKGTTRPPRPNTRTVYHAVRWTPAEWARVAEMAEVEKTTESDIIRRKTLQGGHHVRTN